MWCLKELNMATDVIIVSWIILCLPSMYCKMLLQHKHICRFSLSLAFSSYLGLWKLPVGYGSRKTSTVSKSNIVFLIPMKRLQIQRLRIWCKRDAQGSNDWLRCETLSGPHLKGSLLFPQTRPCFPSGILWPSGQLWWVINCLCPPFLLHLKSEGTIQPKHPPLHQPEHLLSKPAGMHLLI